MADDSRIQLDQADHGLQFHTNLGPDVLYVQKVVANEAISQLFHITLNLVSTRESIPFKEIVGGPATIVLKHRDEEPRYFNGIISSFAQEGADDRYVHYSAELVPWLALLDQKQDCRVFQKKTAVEIIDDVFKAGGFSASASGIE